MHHSITALCLSALALGPCAGEPPLPAGLPAGGVAVTIGVSDASLLADLGLKQKRAVHALVANAAKADALRRELLTKQALGPVQVDVWTDGKQLPYADGLARVVLVADPAAVDAVEAKRITAAFGAVATLQGGAWKIESVAMPADQDEWAFPWHDGGRTRRANDQQVGPPQTASWIAGSLYNNSMMVAGSGVVLVYECSPGTPETIVCRDAGSGIERWRVAMPPSASPRGPAFGLADSWFGGDLQGQRNQAASIIGQRVFIAGETPLVVDIATGQSVSPAIPGPVVRFAALGNAVVAITPTAISAFSRDTLAPAWSVTAKHYDVAVLADRVLYLDTASEPYALVILNNAGKQTQRKVLSDYWVPGLTPKTQYSRGNKMSQMRLLFANAESAFLRASATKGLVCLDSSTGSERWAIAPEVAETKDFLNRPVKEGGNFSNPAMTVLAGPYLWYSNGRVRIAHDPATGKRAAVGWSECVNEDCQWAYGSANWVGFKDNEWMHVTTLARGMSRASSRKLVDGKNNKDGALVFGEGSYTIGNNTCGWQPIIAYGRSFYGTKNCACTNQGIGPRAGLAKSQLPDHLVSDGKVGAVEQGSGKAGSAADGWTHFGGSAALAAHTTVTVGTLTPAWTTTLTPPQASEWVATCYAGRISQPVVAGGLVAVAQHDSGVVEVLDAGNGARKFQLVAGGRISGPPVLINGQIVASANNGTVAAWSSADGALIWRTRVAASERRIGAYGQVEAMDCVAPPTVANDTVLAMTGRFRYGLEGVWTVALDAKTGALRWRKQEEIVPGQIAVLGDALIPAFTSGGEASFSGGMTARSRAVATGLFAPFSAGQFAPGRWSRVAFNARLNTRVPAGLGAWVWADDGANNVGFDAHGSKVIKVAKTVLSEAGKNGTNRIALSGLQTKTLWDIAMAKDEQATAVVVAGDSVLIATNKVVTTSSTHNQSSYRTSGSGNLLVLNLSDGKERSRTALSAPIVHQGIAVVQGLIVLTGIDGQVMAYRF